MKTSFGELTKILDVEDSTFAEYLSFERPGRAHRHNEYESFFVISGRGQIHCGEDVFEVVAGDLVTIPPKVSHWMVPEGDQAMTGFLWYHPQPIGRPQAHKAILT